MDACERVGTNEKDEPLVPIIIEEVTILVDPFKNIIREIDSAADRRTTMEIKKEEKVTP